MFAQRDVDAEFVFVDDASPDGSVDRLHEVMAEYPAVGERVRILRHARNRGVGAARRTAIEAARSTYICFVDSDDALSDDRALAQLSEEARRTDADLIFGGYCEVSPAGRRRIHTPRPDRDRVLRSLLRQDYRTSNRLWGILIRRALHTRYGVWPAAGLNFAEDYVLLSQLVYRAARIAAVDRPFYAYRTANAGSCMNTLTRRSADAYVEANRVVTDFFRAQPDFERWRPALTLGAERRQGILMRGFSPSDCGRGFSHRTTFRSALRSGSTPLRCAPNGCRWCVPSRRRSTPSENETGDLSQRSPVFHAISDRCQRHASRMRRAMAPSTLRASP